MNCITECVLNVLKGNSKLSECNTRNLQKYESAIRKVAERNVSLLGKKRLIIQRGGFLLPLLSAILPTIASLIFKPRWECYVRCTSSRPIITVGGDAALLLESVKRKHLPCEGWVKMRHKFRKADFRRKTRTKAISDFLRRVMPDRAVPSSTDPGPELSKQELIVSKLEAKGSGPPPSFLRRRPITRI